MSRPLPPGDPHQLGPFRLMARLEETSAGIVYLAEDGEGRQVCVAVLTRGSAADAAARDRFRVAIHAEINGGGAPAAGAAPLVAAQPEGHAPWAATAYEPERVGAARFLDSVTLSGSLWRRRAARRRGPQFQPYWTGSTGPALARPAPVPVVVAPGKPERGLVAAVLLLAGMLALMALLLLLLFACQPKVSAPRPAPVDPPSETYQPPLPPPPSVSPSPTPTRPPPTRTPPNEDDPGGGGAI